MSIDEASIQTGQPVNSGYTHRQHTASLAQRVQDGCNCRSAPRINAVCVELIAGGSKKQGIRPNRVVVALLVRKCVVSVARPMGKRGGIYTKQPVCVSHVSPRMRVLAAH